jgi:hypothetical protein
MLVGVSLGIRGFSVRYSFSFLILVKTYGCNAIVATVRNAVVENCQIVVKYARLVKKI